MKFRYLLLAAFGFLFLQNAKADDPIVTSGTVTVAAYRNLNSQIVTYKVDCTSDNTSSSVAQFEANGTIERVIINPGSPAPTALYDITLKDADGFDVLAGGGANLSATVSTSFVPLTTTSNQKWTVNGLVTLSILEMGIGKATCISVIIRK